MSPLVALLALACAAPLAVQANTECSTMSRGIPSHDLIDLPSVNVQRQDNYVQLQFDDKCAWAHKELVGVFVAVCDDQKPSLDVEQERPWSVYVRRTRTSSATAEATVYIIQYCKK